MTRPGLLIGLAVAAALAAGSAEAGTPSVAPRCIALAVEGGDHALTNRCRFGVEVRYCTVMGPAARCGARLAEATIDAGRTVHIQVAALDRLHYAACRFGDVFDTAWARGGASGFAFRTTCLEVGD